MNKVKDKAIDEAMASIENRIRHVYNQGFAEGYAKGKEQTDEIRVGDEVLYHKFYENSDQSHKGVVTNLGRSYSPYAFVMTDDGDFVSALLTDLNKTGRHFPQINEVLKQMRGERK